MQLCRLQIHDLDEPGARESYSVPGAGGVRRQGTRCRACSAESRLRNNRARWARIKNQFMEMYGGKCACCGITRRVFLSLDHVEGGGGVERKADGQRGAYLRAVASYQPDVYRVLCHNCNMAMHHEPNHACP